MIRPRIGAIVAAVSLLLCGSSRSFAQSGDDRTKEARAAFKEGTSLYTQGKFVVAIEVFEKAYQLRPNYRVQCSIALCYERLGKVVVAAERYQRCMDEGAAGSKFAADIKASLEKMKKLITRVEVSSPGQGGTVYLDGEARGETPRTLAIDPGNHVIEVRREGAKPAKVSLKAVGGEHRALSLVPIPELLVSEPPADSPQPATSPSPSRRRVPQYWFWTAAGISVALAAVAVVMGVQTLRLRDDYLARPSQEAYDSFTSRRMLTNIFAFSAGAIAAGTTVLFFFTDFRGRSKEQPVQSSVYGVGLQGTF